MDDEHGWVRIEAEARRAFGHGPFPIRAYSESMPPPYVGIKPYDPDRARAPCTARAPDDGALDVTEYEQAEELSPGLDHIAAHVLGELAKLVRGERHAFSRTLLDGNAAWPPDLAESARGGVPRCAGRDRAPALALTYAGRQGQRPLDALRHQPRGRVDDVLDELRASGQGRREQPHALLAPRGVGRGRPDLDLAEISVLDDPAAVPAVLHDRLNQALFRV